MYENGASGVGWRGGPWESLSHSRGFIVDEYAEHAEGAAGWAGLERERATPG